MKLPPVELRRGLRDLWDLARRRDRRRQRRPHITTVNTEPASQLPDRHLLAFMSTTNLFVQQHLRPLCHQPSRAATTTTTADPTTRRPSRGQIRRALRLQVGPDQKSTPTRVPQHQPPSRQWLVRDRAVRSSDTSRTAGLGPAAFFVAVLNMSPCHPLTSVATSPLSPPALF